MNIMKHPVSWEDVMRAAAGREDLELIYDKLYTKLVGIYPLVMRDVIKPDLLINMLGGFANGLKAMPQFFPVGEKTLADYLDAPELLAKSKPQQFMLWFLAVKDTEEFKHQVIMRVLHHTFKHAVDTETRLDFAVLAREFNALNFRVKTQYLARMYNGMQTTIIEMFLIEELLGE
jgi:hypothetical protein